MSSKSKLGLQQIVLMWPQSPHLYLFSLYFDIIGQLDNVVEYSCAQLDSVVEYHCAQLDSVVEYRCAQLDSVVEYCCAQLGGFDFIG